MGHVRHLNRRKWRETRQKAISRDKFRCVQCGKAGRLEVDHITPLWQDRKQDPYKLDGLRTLCRKCHIFKTKRERETREAARRKPNPFNPLLERLMQ